MRRVDMSVEYMDDLLVPAVPPNTVRESNLETLRRLEQDLDDISNCRLTALDAYRLYWYRNGIHSCWGYCLEAARNITTNEIRNVRTYYLLSRLLRLRAAYGRPEYLQIFLCFAGIFADIPVFRFRLV